MYISNRLAQDEKLTLLVCLLDQFSPHLIMFGEAGGCLMMLPLSKEVTVNMVTL